MSSILVFYGSYRSDRMGIRLADYIVGQLTKRGEDVEFIDAKAVGLPILDRMYKEYPHGTAPANLEALAGKICAADAFLFVTGEYNWGVQPGLKNLTDHFLEEWFWRPAAIASYSAGRIAGARSNVMWHGIVSGNGHGRDFQHPDRGAHQPDADAHAAPEGEPGKALGAAFERFADDLAWWTQAAKAQRAKIKPPF